MREGSDFKNQICATGAAKFDVTHAITAHLGERHFNAALFAGDAFVLHALIFAAQALIVLYRAKNARAEKAVAFWFERPVVNRFRLFDFAKRPGENFLRAGQRNTDLIERLRRRNRIEDV